jgi:hypothetical protein
MYCDLMPLFLRRNGPKGGVRVLPLQFIEDTLIFYSK